MASANHSEQKGQDWGRKEKGPSPFLRELTPGPEETPASPAEMMEGLGCRTQGGAASRQVRSHACQSPGSFPGTLTQPAGPEGLGGHF